MAFAIIYTPDASLDLAEMSKRDAVLVRDAIRRYVTDEPAMPSHKRKELAPNPLAATWELRLKELRVYYDIDTAAQQVRVLRVGRKLRERVYIRKVPTDMRS